MRNLFILFALVSGPAFGASISGHQAICEALVTVAPESNVASVVAHIIGTNLDFASQRERLERLSGAKPLTDDSEERLVERGTKEGRNRTREVLMAELKALGYEPELEEFDKGANVIATIAGAVHPRDVVEVTAHFDSVRNPGADDNGSGVSLVMELARLMKRFPPGRSVRFVFMDLEEQGFGGSQHHARVLKENSENENLLGVIVLDTIAWAPTEPERQLVVMEVGSQNMAADDEVYDRRVRFAQMLMYQLLRMRGRDGTLSVSIETNAAAPRTADHGPYWRNGLPAVLIGEAFEDGLITPKYHSKDDQTWTLNWSFYEAVSRLSAEMLAFVAQASLGALATIEDSELFDVLAREDRAFTEVGIWPPAPLERGPFLPPWVDPQEDELDPHQQIATSILDRAFVLGDLGASAGIIVTNNSTGRAWLVGEKTGIIDLSPLGVGAQVEIAAEVASFGGRIWSVDRAPLRRRLERLREMMIEGVRIPGGMIERRDLPASYFNVAGFRDAHWVLRSLDNERILKTLNDSSRDSVLVLALRSDGEGDEFLEGGLAVRHFDSVQWTPIERMEWDVARSLLADAAPRESGLPAVMLFARADFSEGWRRWVLARLWTPVDRAILLNGNDPFITEF